MTDKTLSNRIFLALIFLTLTSVAASRVGLGRFTAVGLAMSFSVIKAMLIGWFFMRLRHEGWVIRGAVLVGILAVAVLGIGILPDLAVRLK